MSSRTGTRPRKPREQSKRAAPGLPYDKLLRLAPKMKPPQSWYDESTDPFRPERSIRSR